jgi:RNA polymerase sigma-70 factor (ECF subfamily)
VSVATNIDSVDGGPAAAEARHARDDTPLADRFARGDPAAFDELVDRHQERVARLARRLLGWSTDVDDVVQEVFLAALKNATRFRRGSSLETWLTTITLNKCRTHRRGLLARLRFLTGFGAHPTPEEPPADAPAAHAESFSTAQSAIRRLSPREREVIVLHYLEEKPVDEIAHLVGSSRGAVDVRLHRARIRLREILGVKEEDTR